MSISTATLLYLVFALGGVSIYLLLPQRRYPSRMPGYVLGAAALAAFICVLGLRVIVADSTSFYFFLFAVVALVSAARVITHAKPVYSALYFVLTVIAVACLLLLLGAEFLAIALVIIYAGAILVTYLFVIMLAQQSGAPTYDRNAREPFWSVVAGFVLMATISAWSAEAAKGDTDVHTAASRIVDKEKTDEKGNTFTLGTVLMTQYIVATELSAILLLVSMVGAIALARKRIPPEDPAAARGPAIGQIGKEVEPF